MIKVIDDFVNAGYYEVIENNVLDSTFPWRFSCDVTDMSVMDTTSKLFGFTHMIFDKGKSSSQAYQFLLPMFLQAKEETSAKVLLRVRGDMTVNSGEQITHIPHIDMPNHKEHINMIFYIGDSDGDTIIYKEKFSDWTPGVMQEAPKTLTEDQRVTPKANRLVIFSGEHWHTGQSPTNHNRRVILNLNYAENDYRIN